MTENEEHLNARQVHVGRSQSGIRGLFDERGLMVCTLYPEDNPEQLARRMGWRLVTPSKED